MNVKIQQMSEEERIEIIKYGIKRGKIIFFSTLLTIMFGCLLGIAWQSVIFWFCLSILRKYAGGYHADTENRCYVISFIVVAVSLMCVKQINVSWMLGIVLQTISLLVILVLAPVENKNHILDEDEKKQYATRTRGIEMLLYFTYIFLCFINRESAVAVGMANIAVAVSLLFGCVKNILSERGVIPLI